MYQLCISLVSILFQIFSQICSTVYTNLIKLVSALYSTSKLIQQSCNTLYQLGFNFEFGIDFHQLCTKVDTELMQE